MQHCPAHSQPCCRQCNRTQSLCWRRMRGSVQGTMCMSSDYKSNQAVQYTNSDALNHLQGIRRGNHLGPPCSGGGQSSASSRRQAIGQSISSLPVSATPRQQPAMQSAIKCPSSATGTTRRRRPSLRCSAVAAPVSASRSSAARLGALAAAPLSGLALQNRGRPSLGKAVCFALPARSQH